jgi:DNA-binding response OmpR family regulator
MDGLELCRRIRALPEGKKSIILMISGSDETQEIQEAIAAGADDFLRKPADLSRVRERITVLMERIHFYHF